MNAPRSSIARPRRAVVVTTAVFLAWAAIVFFAGPALIRSAYAGESFELLNRVIAGRDEHPVERYLGIWRRMALGLTVVLIAAGSLVYALRGTFRRIPDVLRRTASAVPGRGVAGVVALAVVIGGAAGLAEATNGIVRHRIQHLPTGEFVAGELLWLAPLAAISAFVLLGLLSLGLDRMLRARGLVVGAIPYLFVGIAVYSLMRALAVGFASYAAVALAGGSAVAVGRVMTRQPERSGRAIRTGAGVIVAFLVVWAAIVPLTRILRERRAVSSLPAARADAPNVLVLIWDAARARNLSLYGYERPTTPNLERLAQRGVVFDRAYSTAPWSLPSHASMFTGRLPTEMTAGYDSPLDETWPTLAETLSNRGYLTGGFTGNLFFGSADYGIARGFTRYDSRPPLDATTVLHTWWASRKVTEAVRRATGQRQLMLRRGAADVSAAFRRWARRRGDRPFFAVLNHFDAHEPYLAPEPFNLAFSDRQPRYWLVSDDEVYTDAVLEDFRTAYDTCLLYLDSELQELLDFLEAERELENTMIIVTSDHGEEFGEYHRRAVGHSKTLHAHALHVPLIVVPPGGTTPRREWQLASIRDIPATVMDMLGSAEHPFPGVPLLRAASDAAAGPRLVMATMEKHRFGGDKPWPSVAGEMFSLFRDDWHYVLDARHGERLFDTTRDPWEKQDRIGDPALAPVVAEFRAALDSLAPTVDGVRLARRVRRD